MVIHLVFVNYRSARMIDECLSSFRDFNFSTITIIDNTEDGSDAELLARLAVKYNAVIHPARENRGFGYGMNLGVRYSGCAESDIVWLLNPDMRFESGSISDLCSLLESGEFQVVSPLIMSITDRPRIWFKGGTIKLASGRVEHTDIGTYLSPAALSIGDRKTEFMTGAAMMLKGQTWLELGGFREDLFMYWEDVEFSMRCMAMGAVMAVSDKLIMQHDVGGTSSSQGMSRMFYYFNSRNRLIVLRDIFGYSYILRPQAVVETLRNVVRPLRNETARGRFTKLRGAVKGTIDGSRAIGGHDK